MSLQLLFMAIEIRNGYGNGISDRSKAQLLDVVLFTLSEPQKEGSKAYELSRTNQTDVKL